MRTFAYLLVAVLAIGSPSTPARGASSNDGTRVRIRGVVLPGQLSEDGKKFVADDDSEWIVSNADAVKGLEGRYISVKCRMNPKNGTIQVLSVDPSTTHTVHLGDAAFRR
jgi:hypothetical protein